MDILQILQLAGIMQDAERTCTAGRATGTMHHG